MGVFVQCSACLLVTSVSMCVGMYVVPACACAQASWKLTFSLTSYPARGGGDEKTNASLGLLYLRTIGAV